MRFNEFERDSLINFGKKHGYITEDMSQEEIDKACEEKIKLMTLYIILFLLFIFFMFCVSEIFKLQKEVRKLNNIINHLLKKKND